jgi:hypothetical protein
MDFTMELERTVMKKVIAVAASLLVNLSVVAALEQSASDAVPSGEVFVTDLNVDTDVALAHASPADARPRAVAL